MCIYKCACTCKTTPLKWPLIRQHDRQNALSGENEAQPISFFPLDVCYCRNPSKCEIIQTLSPRCAALSLSLSLSLSLARARALSPSLLQASASRLVGAFQYMCMCVCLSSCDTHASSSFKPRRHDWWGAFQSPPRASRACQYQARTRPPSDTPCQTRADRSD